MTELLVENSMYKDAAGRAAIVANPQLCADLFAINFLGFLGLYALNDSRGYMKTYETTEKKLKIADIADDNHDVSLILKLCVEAGVFLEQKTVAMTKLLSLIKQKVIKAKDVDDAKIRDIVSTSLVVSKPMTPLVKGVLKDFLDGTIGLKEYARQIYDISKKNDFRDFTLEFRTLVIKGQYTDYFTIMKKAGAQNPQALTSQGVAVPGAPAQKAPPKTTLAVAKANKLKDEITAAISDGQLNAFHRLAAKIVQIVAVNKAKWDDVSEIVKDVEFTKWSRSISPPDVLYLRGANAYSGLSDEAMKNLVPHVVDSFIKYVDKGGEWNVSVTAGSLSSQQLQSLVKEIEEFPLPENNASYERWLWASRFAKFTFSPQTLQDIVNRKFDGASSTAHNSHFLFLTTTGTKIIDPATLGSKSAAWIRKWGAPKTVVGDTKIVVSNTMTGAAFKAMSNRDKLVWIANNFTDATSDKLKSWASRERINAGRIIFGLSVDDAKAIRAAFGVSYADDSKANIAWKGSWDSTRMMGAALVAAQIYDIIEGNFVKTSSRLKEWSTEYLASAGSIPALGAAIEKIKSIDYSSATGAMEVTNALSAFGVISFTYIKSIFDVDLKSTDIKKSGAPALLFLKNSESSKQIEGVVGTSDGNVFIDPDICSKEVIEWVKAYGSLGANKIAIIEKTTDEATIALNVFLSSISRQISVGLSRDQVKSVLDKQEDWWIEKIKEWKASNKAPWPISSVVFDTYPAEANIAGHVFDAVDFEELKNAVVWSVINLSDREEMLKTTTYLMRDMNKIDIPVKEDRLPVLEVFAGTSSYRREPTKPETAAAILTTLVQSPSPSQFKTLFAHCTEAIRSDVIITGDFADSIANSQSDFVKGLYFGFLSQNEGILNPQRYEDYKRNTPVSVEDIKKTLEALNGEKHAVYTTSIQNAFTQITKATGSDPRSKEFKDGLNLSGSERYSSANLLIIPWLAEISQEYKDYWKSVNKGSYGTVSAQELARLMENSPGDSAVKDVATQIWDELIKTEPRSIGSTLNGVAKLAKLIGREGDFADIIHKSYEIAVNDKNIKPVDFAQSLDYITDGLDSLRPETVKIIVAKLLTSESQSAQDAITNLAYAGKTDGTVNPEFISAVRAAGRERAVISRLTKFGNAKQALEIINKDPAAQPIQLDDSRVKTFLKFNNIDISDIIVADVKKLEEIGTAQTAFKSKIPSLPVTEITDPKEVKTRIVELHKANRYNHSPALGLEVKRAFKYALPGQKDKFDQWVAANPTTKILTLFHGTGTINAAFIMRFGFKIIPSTDGSVTGRMLGDGIYFADNINKSMLYMSNAGYIRASGQEGYVFKCKVALGNQPKNFREGNASRGNLVSNEWAVFSTDQILVEEVYYGVSREKSQITRMLNEGVEDYNTPVSTFMFMDGMIPIDEAGDILVDFEKFPEFGKHVWIETSAVGPIVNIQHDSTIEAKDYCYRYGEELTATSEKETLKKFIALLKNRY